MPKTYYDSELTAAEIESVLEAIHGVVSPSNNGKILGIESGRFVAKSASEYSGDIVLEPLNVTANGDYYPSSGTDGFSEAHITVPSYPEPTGTINISANGLVNVKDYAEANVQVPSGGSNIEVIPLSVTANDTYTAPAGKAYSPVTVHVSGEGEYFNGELITLLTLDQGNRWIDTGYDVSNVTDFLFFKYLNGQLNIYEPTYKAKSDIAVYTGGADVYTNIFAIAGTPFNVRIYNNTLWVSFNGHGANTNGALSYTGGNFADFMSTIQQS